MTGFIADAALVVLTAAPALEEPLIDWLLDRGGNAGFTSIPVSGHSARHDGLTLTEQVRGRQRRVQFQVHMPVDAVDAFLADARAAFGGTDLHYWVLPIMGGRRLGPDASNETPPAA